MILALRANGFRWLYPAHMLLGILGALVATRLLSLPSVTGVTGVPAALFVALGECALVAFVVNVASPERRLVPVRRPGALLALLLILLVLPPAAILVALDLAGMGDGGIYCGSLNWLLAIQLTTGVLVSSKFQAMGPACYVLLCALLGRAGGTAQPWAWPLASPSPTEAVVAGSAALALSLCLVASLGLHDPHE